MVKMQKNIIFRQTLVRD